MKNIGEDIVTRGSLPSKDTLNSVKEKANKSLLGISYPIKANPINGYFSKASNIQAAKSALYQLLKTDFGERVFLPDFGCSLKSFLFAPFDADLVEDIRNTIVTSVGKYLPFIKILKLNVSTVNDASVTIPTIKVSLWCQLREDLNSTFEIGVVV